MLPSTGRAGRHRPALPILLTPWRDGAAVVAETSIGFTRDLSNQGAGLIALKELQEEKFVVTIAPPAGSVEPPYHFVAHLRGINPMALGLWIAHLEFEQSVSGKGSNLPELDDVAKKALLPILEEATEPTSV